MKMPLNIRIGGEAGQGINTLTDLLSRSLLRAGYCVFNSSDYMSRIRGGHNFMDVRVHDTKVSGPEEGVDLLLALDGKTQEEHRNKLKERAFVIYDSSDRQGSFGQVPLPLVTRAQEIGDKRAAGVLALGAVLKLLGLPLGLLEESLKNKFKGTVLDINLSAAGWGYGAVKEQVELPPGKGVDGILLSGNEALALGAIAAGVHFYAAYPMTPATGILDFLARYKDDFKIVVEQAEDEIAAVNMVLGAAYGGARSLVGTSGGGFSLMVEGLSLAGMTETPLVIINAQRPGPATGFPTRTEQADLNFVVRAGHGEFPRLVLAPRNVEEAFYQTIRAFNIADRYQMPVIILTDQHLADSQEILSGFSEERVSIKRGKLLLTRGTEEKYKRYAFTHDGISPRLIPGAPGDIVMVDSDEHNQEGYIVEDSFTRQKMVEKRMARLPLLEKEEVQKPLYLGPEPDEADLLIMSWGSNFGVLEEVREMLKRESINIGHLSFQDLWPVPRGSWEDWIKKTPSLLMENNFSGQLGQLLCSAGVERTWKSFNKYDGRPFRLEEVKKRLQEEVSSHGV